MASRVGKPVDTRIVSLVLGARPSAVPFKLAARPEMPQETGSQPLLHGMTRLANNKRIHIFLSRAYFKFFSSYWGNTRPLTMALKNKKGQHFCWPFWVEVTCLEAEPCSKLASERAWQQAAGRIDESNRVSKSRKPNSAIEVIAVIGMVRKVESLEH